jgi:hypothetical protein
VRDFRPDILCEVLPDPDGDLLEDLLRPAGLQRYLVTNVALEARERIVPDREHRDQLFTRRSPDELRALGLPVR